ncbi:unnamed protein product [Paramecium octaurelia]|uniref:Uncharacterized protein n=1 Tax=Paramecium octaurelia TaxID=43137 RepID=A0A8S1Y7U2_PAROT|nr:unnamed protein product [Paramecium octaurelia]
MSQISVFSPPIQMRIIKLKRPKELPVGCQKRVGKHYFVEELVFQVFCIFAIYQNQQSHKYQIQYFYKMNQTNKPQGWVSNQDSCLNMIVHKMRWNGAKAQFHMHMDTYRKPFGV